MGFFWKSLSFIFWDSIQGRSFKSRLSWVLLSFWIGLSCYCTNSLIFKAYKVSAWLWVRWIGTSYITVGEVNLLVISLRILVSLLFIAAFPKSPTSYFGLRSTLFLSLDYLQEDPTKDSEGCTRLPCEKVGGTLGRLILNTTLLMLWVEAVLVLRDTGSTKYFVGELTLSSLGGLAVSSVTWIMSSFYLGNSRRLSAVKEFLKISESSYLLLRVDSRLLRLD